MQDRRDVPPTWRGSVNRALLGAGLFFVLVFLPFHQPLGTAIALASVTLVFYVPLGYYMDRFFYNRRQAAKRKTR